MTGASQEAAGIAKAHSKGLRTYWLMDVDGVKHGGHTIFTSHTGIALARC